MSQIGMQWLREANQSLVKRNIAYVKSNIAGVRLRKMISHQNARQSERRERFERAESKTATRFAFLVPRFDFTRASVKLLAALAEKGNRVAKCPVKRRSELAMRRFHLANRRVKRSNPKSNRHCDPDDSWEKQSPAIDFPNPIAARWATI